MAACSATSASAAVGSLKAAAVQIANVASADISEKIADHRVNNIREMPTYCRKYDFVNRQFGYKSRPYQRHPTQHSSFAHLYRVEIKAAILELPHVAADGGNHQAVFQLGYSEPVRKNKSYPLEF